jgi:hypothetical protein
MAKGRPFRPEKALRGTCNVRFMIGLIVVGPALAGALFVVIFDPVASYAAETLHFPYPRVWPITALAYAAVGFAAMRSSRAFRAAIATAVCVGLVEATVGWTTTWQLGATRLLARELTGLEIVYEIVAAVVASAVLGAIGAGVARVKA